MATCDHNYKLTLVDCGAYGSNNDAGVFARSEFAKALQNGNLNLPTGEANLPDSDIKTPCFFLADEAFQLATNMMRPYSDHNLEEKKRIFNYRLSRARRIIENAFGILVSRWRIFRKPICMYPKTVDKIIMATICLHNFLETVNDLTPANNRLYCPLNFVDVEQENGDIIPGTWRNEYSGGIECIRPTTAHRSTMVAYRQRDAIVEYLLTPAGEVTWQKDYIHRGSNAPHIR